MRGMPGADCFVLQHSLRAYLLHAERRFALRDDAARKGCRRQILQCTKELDHHAKLIRRIINLSGSRQLDVVGPVCDIHCSISA
jgi:hypothetical protein